MAVALALISGVVGAIGALQSAGAAAAAAKYNEQVAKRNARATMDQTLATIEDKTREHRRQLGALRTAYSANGLMFEGSPMDVLEDSSSELAYDVAKIKYQGKMKAEGYTEQAALFKLEGKAAKKEGFIGAATSMLSGVTDAVTANNSGSGYSLQMS